MALSCLRRVVAAGVVVLGLRAPCPAADPVAMVVLQEHGVGNQALAQPYLDRMVALAAVQNAWTGGATGRYFTNRKAAEDFVASARPHYGILSLSSFLALRERHKLGVIGRVEVSLAGGRRYYLISKTANTLAGCKGKTLATDHADDRRFLDRVVFDGDATLADFTLVETQRPLQTIKTVMTDKAVCALIDDAQKEQLDHLEDKQGVHQAWQSDELPPMPVVAFPNAPAAERERFKQHLDELCDDDGKPACAEVGIDDLTSADATEYADIVRAYGR